MATKLVHIAVTAVTDAGAQSSPTRTSATITDGVLIGQAPNAVRARAAAAPDGAIDVTVLYAARGQSGAAVAVEIVERVLGSQADFTTPLATVAVGRSITGSTVRLAGPWDHGETVHLAARAITDDDPVAAGPVTLLRPVVAADTGPPAAGYLEAAEL